MTMAVLLRHVGIVVRDLDRALKFYEDLLGFKVRHKELETGACLEKVLGLPEVEVTTVKMVDPKGNGLELLQFHSHAGTQARGLTDYGTTHLAVTVENLDALYKELLNQGIEFLSAPQTAPSGKAKLAFCKDPDGTFIELVELL